MSEYDQAMREHISVTRRFFLQLAAGTAVSSILSHSLLGAELPENCAKACDEFLKKLEYLTSDKSFRNVSRGNPKPYSLPEDKKREVGLLRETWKLEVISDPDHQAAIENPLTKENGNAFTWDDLMKLAEKHAVSVPKIMTCNNIGRPLGMGIWEGVPLREVIWMTKPKENIRRVFYNGYHNDDPKQIFRSSLPIGRVLEDPFDLPPILLCYKVNGHFLSGERGAPVRMLVPEAYGFKSVKWLTKIVLSNLYHANDTYASGNNDVDSFMKTFARSLLRPDEIKSGQSIPITGYAQVGISGLKKVQTLLLTEKEEESWNKQDPYYLEGKWNDAHILPPPEKWGGDLPENQVPQNLHGFKRSNRKTQPLADETYNGSLGNCFEWSSGRQVCITHQNH